MVQGNMSIMNGSGAEAGDWEDWRRGENLVPNLVSTIIGRTGGMLEFWMECNLYILEPKVL